jgi:hypothetical protein
MRPFTILALSALALPACGFDDLHFASGRTDCNPTWIWFGEQAHAPSCPGGYLPAWEAWSEPVSPVECGACACGPAACVLPSRVTAHEPICAGGDGASTTFDAGDGWDGLCAARAAPMPDEAFASVTYEPPALAACAPSPTPAPPAITGTFARACEPSGELPSGFHNCIAPKEDGSCIPDFSIRREWFDLIDHRACTPCACDEPSGGRCTARITLYGSAGCGDELDVAIISHTDQPLCQDVTDGSIVAMQARLTQEDAGACTPATSISAVTGTVERGERHEYCCAD